MTRKSLTVPLPHLGLFILAAWFAFLSIEPSKQWIDDLRTPQPWFSSSLAVPDHVLGSDPVVLYERHIMRFLRGDWTAQAYWIDQENDTRQWLCSGGEPNEGYRPGGRPTIHLSLSLFLGVDPDECAWSVGTHEVCYEHVMTDPAHGWARVFTSPCARFEVLPDDEANP